MRGIHPIKADAAAPKKAAANPRRSKTRYWTQLPLGFILPAGVLIFCVILYPVIYNLYISFFRIGLRGFSARSWVGLANYTALLTSKTFWQITGNTLIWVLGITLIMEALGLIAALLLNQRVRGRAIYRAIMLLPWVIPGVVTGILWEYMYDPQFGVINDVLQRLGLITNYVPWLGQMNTSLLAVIVAYVWKVYPMVMIMILARLQGIPDEIYEVSKLDGAGRLATLRYITLPILKSTLAMTTVLMMITAFNSFDLTYIMTGGGPINSSEILGMFIYDLGFKQFDFGGASATATLMFLVSFGLIVFYAKWRSRQDVK